MENVWKEIEEKANDKNKLGTVTTLRTKEWSKKHLYRGLLCTQLYMSNLIHTYFTFFFFFFRLFDNVSAIRFILSLVKYHNCFITIFLKEKTGKTYRYKHYLQSRHAHNPSFHVKLHACCSSSLNISPKKKLTRAGLYSRCFDTVFQRPMTDIFQSP